MKTNTATQWIEEYQNAIDLLRNTKNVARNNNNSNDIRKYRIAIGFLQSVPTDWTFNMKLDGVAFNDKQDACTIGNNGVLAEEVIRYHLRKRKIHNEQKRAQGKDDWCNTEIKTAMSCRWLATKSPFKKTILVNACGVFKLTAEEVKANVDKHGRLPYNKAIGTIDEETIALQDALGLWD